LEPRVIPSKAPKSVDVVTSTGTVAVPISFTNELDLIAVSGSNLDLNVAGFVKLTGDLTFTKETVGNITKITIGAGSVNAFLGTPDGSVGVRITNAELGVVLYKNTTTNASSYALSASAGISLVGLDNVLSLSGTAAAMSRPSP
jgi:hypothetical protein